MLTLPGYHILKEIHIGSKTIIYRGLQEAEQKHVIIKLLKPEYLTFHESARFKYEYEITKSLNLEGVIKALNLETSHNRTALILEDFGGESLKKYLGSQKVQLPEFLLIAIQIADILIDIHKQGVLHKDIKPSNIIIHPKTGQIKLTDFAIASRLERENQSISNPNLLEGTLAYMSPEQTGRMNRSIDYRSDFYSVGVTFYEILTGQLPFETTDPMELVHCHIAKQPVNPQQISPAIPTVVSEIVMKLLAKTAEERYQTASGLKADLETCLTQLRATGQIESFPLGQQDKSGQFQIPQKLYGREAEVNTLLETFTRVSLLGKSEMMLVSGYSGIGKSALVNEIHKPIVGTRGYFISGKFDQYKRNIPYASLIQAFQSLMRQLLTESTQQLETWKTKLLEAFGQNGQIIIDVIPEVELIVGSQPAVAQMGATESKNRFNRVFKEFIHVFTQKEHPLVIFLDDLQWADSASLKLISLLMGDADSQYLLLIGAYRDNEVSGTHPLIVTLEEIEKAGGIINDIHLKPLEVNNVKQLIADTLNSKTEKVEFLAKLLFEKTAGNPFFLTQLLTSLYQENLLTFDFSAGCWLWDMELIQGLGISENVVELMVGKIQKLSESTQTILRLAACIGNRFDLSVLAVVNETSLSATVTQLWEALQAGLIVPLSDAYKALLVMDSELGGELTDEHLVVEYKFLHDRVQQAAYAMIPDYQKQEVHLKIGQLLLKNSSPEEQDENLFDIVNHLNLGAELITLQSEKDELAKLNLTAGQKAKAATAYEPALRYLNMGLRLLGKDSWEHHPELTLRLSIEALEGDYINANFKRAQQLSDMILLHCQTLLDKVRVYELKISYYFTQNKLQTAINTALKVLKILKVNLPQETNDLTIKEELAQTKLLQANRQIADLAMLPEMTDLEQLAAMRILMAIVPAAFVSNPNLFLLAIFKMVSLSLKYGNAPISCFGYNSYGTIHCGLLNNIDAGYEYGQLALTLLEKFQQKELKSRVYFVFNVFIRHWKEHVGLTIEGLLEGIQSGLETGDIENACHCAAFYCIHLFLSGQPLSSVKQKQISYIEMMEKSKQEFQVKQAKLWHQVILNLQNASNDKTRLVGESFDEDVMLPLLIEAKSNMVIFPAYLAKLILCFLFEDYAKSLENATQAEKYIDGVIGTMYVPIHTFYFSLTLLALSPVTPAQVLPINESEQPEYLKKASVYQEKMKHWADHNPANYLHKYELLEAERARVLGQYDRAMEYYDRAIRGAKEHGYLPEEALALELAAKFYFSRGREKLGTMYLIDAYQSYTCWGAKAKAEDLSVRYSEFLSHLLSTSISARDLRTTRSTSLTTGREGSAALDLATVMKAYQAISGEIVQANLLHKLMQILMENAGAQAGLLLLKKEGTLVLAAEGSVEPEMKIELPFIPVTLRADLPQTVLNYVERTQEIVVLNDATSDGLFINDRYVVNHKPKSIICLPIIHQGKLTGILYLENRLTEGAFTSERVEVLSLLSTQASISLENALLYESMEQKVAARTHELNEKNVYLEQTLAQLKQTQIQLIQNEKMSSLGQLVAGIAHEINNPINFIYGNLSHANEYTQDLLSLIELYTNYYPNPTLEIQEKVEAIDLEFLVKDLPEILRSMKVGTARIREIVKSLRNFSRLDEAHMKPVNIHEGIDNTLLILHNRLVAKVDRPVVEVHKEYGQLPLVDCYASQLNQVFLNILTNAIDALEKSPEPTIWIRTEMVEGNQVNIHIADNGIGMSDETKKRIFDPFFTTKTVGKGTGLGLSISYQIVIEKHGGQLMCISHPGQGTELIIQIPIRQSYPKNL